MQKTQSKGVVLVVEDDPIIRMAAVDIIEDGNLKPFAVLMPTMR
jgi:hypothetical protein